MVSRTFVKSAMKLEIPSLIAGLGALVLMARTFLHLYLYEEIVIRETSLIALIELIIVLVFVVIISVWLIQIVRKMS